MPSGAITTYAAVPPRFNQQVFPNPRRSVKRKTSALPPRTKRQSTLTQLDFATPTTARCVGISSSGDGADDADGRDFEDPRPAKRKRRSKATHERSPDQSTMTQFERGELSAMLSRSKSDSSPTTTIAKWEEYGSQQFQDEEQNASPAQSMYEGVLEQLEIPETSQVQAESPKDTRHAVHDDIKPLRDAIRTPKMLRFTKEIPSSQTPPSTKSSFRSVRLVAQSPRSPLKESSVNIGMTNTPKALSISSQRSVIQLASNRPEIFDAEDDASQGLCLPPPPPRSPPEEPHSLVCGSQRLHEAHPVPDSQIEDAGPSRLIPGPKSLTRIRTVQDSQIEDLDFEETDGYDMRSDWRAHQIHSQLEESQYVFHEDELGPATFDPAFSALDRDAARFGQTQTQRRLGTFRTVHSIELPPLGGQDIAPAEVSQRVQEVITPEKSSSARARAESRRVSRSPAGLIKDQPHSQKIRSPQKGVDHDVQRPHNASNTTDMKRMPPPPSPLRPSQVSTVVPSQFSPRSSQPHLPQVSDSRLPESRKPPIVISSSPHPQFSLLSEIPSSSPLRMPPQTPLPAHNVGNASLGVTTSQESVSSLDDLVDFSLPPPPPLRNSRRK